MKFRKRYEDPNNDRVRDLTRTRNDEPSKTQQHHAVNCDLNTIMKQYGVVKDLPISPYPAHLYGDDNVDLTLTEAYDNVRTADEYFHALPSSLRNKFNNSPLALWAFINDPRNADEAVDLGLLKRDDAPDHPPAGDVSENGTVPT